MTDQVAAARWRSEHPTDAAGRRLYYEDEVSGFCLADRHPERGLSGFMGGVDVHDRCGKSKGHPGRHRFDLHVGMDRFYQTVYARDLPNEKAHAEALASKGPQQWRWKPGDKT